jgi:hypothetical protein
MALKAICPNCNVANEPSATNCEICKTAMGATLVGARGDGAKFFAISMVVSIGFYLICWIVELHPLMLPVSVFYGTLLTSYFARHNVVWASALGGLVAILAVLVIKIAAAWASSKGLFMAILGGTTDVYRDRVQTGTVVAGAVVLLVATFPISLIGASVGEHLSVRRRKGSA